jgi:predicted dehydrogenase
VTASAPTGPAIGLIGCGAWGRFILRDLLRLGCRVVVADPATETRGHAERAGASAALPRLDDLPAGLAGLVVATPTSSHAAVIERLLPCGLPLFVEKPLTADPSAARDLARRAGDRLFVMDKWRYHPGIEAVAAIVRSGELGPVRRISTLRLGWHDHRTDVDTVWSLLPHDLAIALEILGQLPEPVQAIADVAAGTIVGLAGVLGCEPELVVKVSDRHPAVRRQIVVDCLGGAVELAAANGGHLTIRRHDAAARDSSTEYRQIGGTQPLERELAAFLAHLRGGPPPRSSAADGAAIVAAVAGLLELAERAGGASAPQHAAATRGEAPERPGHPP